MERPLRKSGLFCVNIIVKSVKKSILPITMGTWELNVISRMGSVKSKRFVGNKN